MISDTATRVLIAAMTQPQPSVQSIATAVDRNKSTVHAHLTHLRRLGLVTWEYGKQGTLRATCEVVPEWSNCRSTGGNLDPTYETVPSGATNAHSGPRRPEGVSFEGR